MHAFVLLSKLDKSKQVIFLLCQSKRFYPPQKRKKRTTIAHSNNDLISNILRSRGLWCLLKKPKSVKKSNLI